MSVVDENGYVDVARATDIEEGRLLGVEIDGEQIVVARYQGVLFALGGICTHQYALLADGELYQGRVVCPLHGSEFDLATGAAMTLPATEPQPVYEVKVDSGRVLVSRTPRQ